MKYNEEDIFNPIYDVPEYQNFWGTFLKTVGKIYLPSISN